MDKLHRLVTLTLAFLVIYLLWHGTPAPPPPIPHPPPETPAPPVDDTFPDIPVNYPENMPQSVVRLIDAFEAKELSTPKQYLKLVSEAAAEIEKKDLADFFRSVAWDSVEGRRLADYLLGAKIIEKRELAELVEYRFENWQKFDQKIFRDLKFCEYLYPCVWTMKCCISRCHCWPCCHDCGVCKPCLLCRSCLDPCKICTEINKLKNRVSTLENELDAHKNDHTNPHQVDAGQAGADAVGAAAAVQANLDSHNVPGNPHGITPAAIGAELAGAAAAVQANLDSHNGATNPHGITPAGIGAEAIGAAAAVQANVDAHAVAVNPHGINGTTFADGAIPEAKISFSSPVLRESQKGVANGVAGLDGSGKVAGSTVDFSSVPDNNIPGIKVNGVAKTENTNRILFPDGSKLHSNGSGGFSFSNGACVGAVTIDAMAGGCN